MGHYEGALAEHVAEAVSRAAPVAGPDEPGVAPWAEPAPVAAVAPLAMHLEAGRLRPPAEDLVAAAEELDVVVPRTLGVLPAQARRKADVRAAGGAVEPRRG